MTALHKPKQNHLFPASPAADLKRMPLPETSSNSPQNIVNYGSLLQHKLPLGRREREVLQHLADGFSASATAKRMYISVSTVEVHRRNIRQKLDLHNIAELTKYAIRNGITSL